MSLRPFPDPASGWRGWVIRWLAGTRRSLCAIPNDPCCHWYSATAKSMLKTIIPIITWFQYPEHEIMARYTERCRVWVDGFTRLEIRFDLKTIQSRCGTTATPCITSCWCAILSWCTADRNFSINSSFSPRSRPCAKPFSKISFQRTVCKIEMLLRSL